MAEATPIQTVTLKAYEQKFAPAIEEALTKGDLTKEDSSVETKAKKLKADNTVEEFKAAKSYVKLIAKTPHGALVLAGGNADDLLTMVSNSFDSGVRQNVRNAILSELEGPEASIRRLVNQLMKTTGCSEEEARGMVLSLPAIKKLLEDAEKQPIGV